MLNSDIEILAPCGSFDILKAAIKAGADACYIGGSKFGARAYADNLSNDQLEAAIDYTHIHGKRLYLTVNTLIKENELSDVFSYIKACYMAGIDAFIVQDLGLFKMIREYFPDALIHCSTQMNITSYHAAAFMKNLGASRVVTAREMSIEEIKKIKENVDIEVETFVHGAMCYSYSGQCLMSSLAGGRSGNRGRCAQPCRKCYDGKYLLSMKDMCTLTHIPELVQAGIDSFKIEGRMKNEYYVMSAVNAYRELTTDYLNGCFSKKKAEEYEFKLANIYNRGGFCDGYFFMHNGPEMISLNRPNNQGVKIGKLISVKDGKALVRLSEDIYNGDVLEFVLKNKESIDVTSGIEGKKKNDVWINAPKTKNMVTGQDIYRTRCRHILDETGLIDSAKILLSGKLKAKKGEPIAFEISLLSYGDNKKELINDYNAEVYGPVVEQAKDKKCDLKMIEEKLSGLGGTDYKFANLLFEVDEDAFVPASILKKLRREAVTALENNIKLYYKRNIDDTVLLKEKYIGIEENNENNYTNPRLKIKVTTVNQLKTVLKYPDIYGIYFEKNLLNKVYGTSIWEDIKKRNIKIYIELPYVIKSDFEYAEYVGDIPHDGVYIRNIDAFSFEMDYNIDIVCGAGLYAYNNFARHFIKERFGSAVIELPKELNVSEIKQLDTSDSELCIYEYQQVMLSNNCIKKSRGICNNIEETVKITDEKNNAFYAYSKCGECVNAIFNGIPFLCFDKDELKDFDGVKYYRMNFTVEEAGTVDAILKYYYEKTKPDMIFTTGHMYRGVE